MTTGEPQPPDDSGWTLLVRTGTHVGHDEDCPNKQFPMQDGPSIPWSLAERIYFVYADLFGQQQSLERLAKRGGFGWGEIPVFRKEYRQKHGRYPDWSVTCDPTR